MHLYRRRQNNMFGAGLLAFLAGAAAWALFGPKIREKMEKSSDYQDLKRKVMDQASSISDLTRDKYDQIVDEVTNNFAKVKSISQNELKDLAADLKFYWYRIKDRWNSPTNLNSGSI